MRGYIRMIAYQSNYYGVMPLGSDELYHHGVKGMHWGVRRFQNDDGSLTAAGRRRYGVETSEKPVSRSNIRRTLRRADDAMSEIDYQARRSDKRMLKIGNKASKVIDRAEKRKTGPTARDSKKLNKLTQKLHEEGERRIALRKSQEEIRSGISKSIAKALTSGYSIHSKEYVRDVREGKHLFAQLTGGIGAQILSRAVSDSRVVGVRYRVTKTKDGSNPSWTHDSRSKSAEYIKKKDAARRATIAGEATQRLKQAAYRQ
jgi:hypothetical protein